MGTSIRTKVNNEAHVDYTEKRGDETSLKLKFTQLKGIAAGYKASRDFIVRLARDGNLPFLPERVGTNILQDLKQKAAHLSGHADWQKVVYYIFARSGFTADLKDLARKEGVQLVSLSDGTLVG